MATEKYCRVENGQITWGPGILGRWVEPDGTIRNLREYNPQQLKALGFLPVIRVGQPAYYDEDFMYISTPTYVVNENDVTEQVVAEFKPGAKALIFRAIDRDAEKLRDDALQTEPGKIWEYMETWEQAKNALQDIANNITILEGDYPFLDAAVGTTVDSNDLEVDTVEKAANEVANARQQMNDVLKSIRTERLRIRKLVRTAPSEADALQAYKSAVWSI